MSNLTISDSIKQQLLTQLYEQFDDAIFILDTNLCYIWVNATYELMIGYDESFLLGRPLGIYDAEFLAADERAILKDISAHLDKVGFYKRNFSMATRYGQILDCHMTYQRISIDGSDYYVGMVRDVSSVAKDKAEVTHLLNFDRLTGLPNRKVFLTQISELLIDSYQEIVVVRFNIDRYRNLIDALGLDRVNSLVVALVDRISRLQMQNLYNFAHFGGDDFAFLFECDDANTVRNQMNSLMQVSELPFLLNELSDDFLETNSLMNEALATDLLGDTKIYLHLSVGISYSPRYSHQSTELLIKAEKALHYVKEHGGDDVYWYHDDLDKIVTGSLQLESELRMAIDNCQFVAYYQPKVELETGTIVGFEALVRWQHPTRGLLRPIDFIEDILEYKLSFELFCQMAIQIAKQLAHWQVLGLSNYICINADAAEFNNPKFFEFFSNLFIQYDIKPQKLHIEVTESSLMLRHSNVKRQLLALKSLGVYLELDDFGTGYASLSYLQEYPFDFIKIDKSFILQLTDNKTQQAIVKAILDLAAALDMDVVAEGIETEHQLNLLIAMGCRYGQGYLFSHPMTEITATQMLTDKLKFH